jgi:hypothetical protein
MAEDREVWQILQSETFTPEIIGELRVALTKIQRWDNAGAYRSLMARQSVETLDAIRLLRESIESFDNASGELVNTTHRLTSWVLGLTLVAVVFAAGNIVATAWPYFSWWRSHR